MTDKLEFDEALKAAAALFNWESDWTMEGEHAQSLSAWYEAARGRGQGAPTFVLDGKRIVHQGSDIQDYRIVLYLAEERCDSCGKFLVPSTAEKTRASVVVARLCIGCASGGTITREMFG